ncbi:50S ribosomal protein L11 methyltransferase [Synechococcus sp. RedBA-s]|uniref:50S ribosomal protein L11 methyltransferase n=1 Tax=Synechococcus sp. RedBA-s TaxID=2823741 RepID=UPI0020CF3658|nr:50S ribosomal protein L11 methyltransferase [Synechococcus sp. RedBA-s]MCP9801328.1 50S ribosomal protein L11 methyltransferase [Synechococcus sp. RedBA-s]
MSPAPRWWRLEMEAPPELEESLLWKLPSLGIRRVAIQFSPDQPREHQLVAWLPEVDWPQPERLRLAEELQRLTEPFAIDLPPLTWALQDEEDWSLSWKRHWQPDPVGERLLILPAWLEPPVEYAGRELIRIDPGSAFGTGSHPTTRLCLEAMERLAPIDQRVADLGCGSGILGLGALRLGARCVAAADTDPLAVRATTSNAELNGSPVRPGGPLQVVEGSALELAVLLGEAGPADLLLCNILAPVIAELAGQFRSLLAPAGVGLLSGLLVDQAEELCRLLALEGWRAELVASQGVWGLLQIQWCRAVIPVDVA